MSIFLNRWPHMEVNIGQWVVLLVPLTGYFICVKTLPSIPREKLLPVVIFGIFASSDQVITSVTIFVQLFEHKRLIKKD